MENPTSSHVLIALILLLLIKVSAIAFSFKKFISFEDVKNNLEEHFKPRE